MNKWYKCVCLSFCLSLGAAQTKQTAVFRKQGRATRVFCLVVHFNTHTHMLTCTHIHSPKCPALLIFYLPPCVFCPAQSLSTHSLFLCWAPLLSVMLAHYKTKRNATPCDLSPTTRRGAGLDKRARGSCSHVPGPGRKHTDTNIHIQVVRWNANALILALFCLSSCRRRLDVVLLRLFVLLAIWDRWMLCFGFTFYPCVCVCANARMECSLIQRRYCWREGAWWEAGSLIG